MELLTLNTTLLILWLLMYKYLDIQVPPFGAEETRGY